MNRRESIKSLLIGSVAGGLLLESCGSGQEAAIEQSLWKYQYGRTPKEQAHDEKLLKETFFADNELVMVVVLANLILPPTAEGTIEEANVPEFIEFMMKDYPPFQTPIRGGLMWLNTYSNKHFGKLFVEAAEDQQKSILDTIAYPDPNRKTQTHQVQFFTLFRNLVMTGYFTSAVGVAETGYAGNMPNVWDGVPEDVLKSVGMSYEKEWTDRCIDQSKRNDQAVWDEDGNLLT